MEEGGNCQFCGVFLSTNRIRENHTKKQHSDIDWLVISNDCDICSLSFGSPVLTQAHKKAAHKAENQGIDKVFDARLEEGTNLM